MSTVNSTLNVATKFFAVHGDEEHQPLPRHLQCAEVLKRELARQATCAFTEAVSTIILQNLGWVANQHLNRKINIVAARTVTTGTRKAAELVVKIQLEMFQNTEKS